MCAPPLFVCGPVQGDDKNTPSSFSQKVSHKGLGHKMSTTMWCEMGGLFWVQFQNSNVVEWAVFSVLQETKPHWCPTTRGQDTHHTREPVFHRDGRPPYIYIYHCQISTVNGRESSTSKSKSKSSMTSTATTLLASILLPLIAFSDAAVGSSLLFFLLLAFAQRSLHYFPNYFSFNCLLQFQAIAERRKSVSLTKVAK